jgi:hypothetical protein
MDAALVAIQELATLLQLPVLLTILPGAEDPVVGVFEPVRVSPWCAPCKRHHD